MLLQAKSSPDFNNYLTYIFSCSSVPTGLPYTVEEYHGIRSQAAVTLKNNIKTGYKTISQSSLALIRSSVPLALQDKSPQIRNYAGNIITELVTKGGFLSWPEILSQLIELVSNADGNVAKEAQEGAMTALVKICEDNKKSLDKDYQGQRPLNVLLPKLIEFTTSPLPKVRSAALTSINVFIPQKPQALLVHLDTLLNQLFNLAHDEIPDVRRQVCRAFVQIVEIRPDKILPHISGLVDYIIAQQLRTDEEDLACDAAEFWLSVGEHEVLWQSLGPYLEKIIPVLLESMVYSDEDIVVLGGADDDEDEEDKIEDIAPTFAKSKGARNGAASNGDANIQNGGYVQRGGADDLEEGELEPEDDEDEDDNPEDRWNLRKCSAAALDVFATDFGSQVFQAILPYLLTNLRHEEWPHREAAVLALGAVAEGCMETVEPHLPELIPYLISLLNDKEPLVRQITCWTLGRYSAWGAKLQDPSLRSKYFEPMMEGILMRMLDKNKRVQEAGASAFAHLEENARQLLIPYCEPILNQFAQCFDRYKDKNIFILYDCVQTLAEYVGPHLANERLVQLIMPSLLNRWTKIADSSRELFPLLECLSYVASALGNVFAPYAGPIFARCIKIIHTNLQDYMTAISNDIGELPDKDFLVTSLDLLSAIIQALDNKTSEELVANSEPRFFDLLAFCMEDAENDVRQSAYALLGDCAKYVFPQLQTSLNTVMPVLIKQLDLSQVMEEQKAHGFSVVNNACWSAGEIAIHQGNGMAPYVEDLFKSMLNIIGNPEVPKSVNENAAIALGRLGLENADAMAPHLAMFSGPFLSTMDSVEHTDEKASAFTGFTMVVGRNPQAMEKNLGHFFTSIARYQHDLAHDNPYKMELQNLFAQVSPPS